MDLPTAQLQLPLTKYSEGYVIQNKNITSKVGKMQLDTPVLKQGRFSNIGETEAIYPPHGKKLLNFSNYSLNPDNIITAQNMTDNKIYSSFLKE